jgi:hypothetical protein
VKVLVVGCDVYADLAPRFTEYWYRAWPGCPYDIEFVADTEKLQVSAPVVYTHRNALDYGGKLHDYLIQCRDDLVLILMIDFCTAYVDVGLVEHAVKVAGRSDVGRVQLSRPGNNLYSGPMCPAVNDDQFRAIPCHTRYALSTHVGIWNREFLLEFVQPGEEPWSTEIQGTSRMHAANCGGELLLATRTPAIYVVNTHRFGEEQCGEDELDSYVSSTRMLALEHREKEDDRE